MEQNIDKEYKEKIDQEVNFIDYEKREDSLAQQLFKWTIASGRKIIIFTEIVVLTVFLSRFSLDRKMYELKSSIESKQSIIKSSSEIEDKHRQIQNKLALLKSILDIQIDWNLWLDDFTNKIPDNLVLEGLSISRDKASISAKTANAQSFAVFINLLLTDESIKSIVMTASEFDKETKEFSFTLKFDLVQDDKYLKNKND